MENNPNQVDRWLDALADGIKNRKQPGARWRRFGEYARRALKCLNGLHALLLVLLLLLMEWVGERHWLTAFCLYVPGQFWLLPLLPLSPLTLLFCRRWLWLHAACVLLVAFGYYQFEWSWPPASKKTPLRVMTNNFGQNNRQVFTAFMQSETPDLIALQEAPGQAVRLARGYTNYQAKTWGQFVLLSKLPILNSGYVPVSDRTGVPVGAWFEVGFQSRTVVVYNVHLPSPRRELYRGRGLGFLAALAGTGQETTRTGRYRQELDDTWNQRVKLARQLSEHLRKEQRPFIVAGDFNMPSRGHIHGLFASHLTDAFAACGRGYGLTFPGYTSNPLTLFGPWLRIDYLFAGRGFKPIYCNTERERKSQHRAVAARFEMAE